MGPFWVERPLEELSPGRHPSCQTHSRCLLPHGQYCYQLGMSLQGRQREGEIHGPASETSVLWAELEFNCISETVPSKEACKHTLGGCLFFPEEGSLSLHPANSLSQPPGKALLGVPFLGAVIPELGAIGSSPTLRERQTQLHTSLPSPLLCRTALVSLGLSENSWLWREHTLCVNLHARPGGHRAPVLLEWALKQYSLARAWKSIQLRLSYLWQLALLRPLAVWREEGPTPSPSDMGPTLRGKAPWGAEPIKAPSHVKHTPTACFFMGSTAISLECLCKDRKGKGRYMALPLELWSSEQIWEL